MSQEFIGILKLNFTALPTEECLDQIDDIVSTHLHECDHIVSFIADARKCASPDTTDFSAEMAINPTTSSSFDIQSFLDELGEVESCSSAIFIDRENLFHTGDFYASSKLSEKEKIDQHIAYLRGIQRAVVTAIEQLEEKLGTPASLSSDIEQV